MNDRKFKVIRNIVAILLTAFISATTTYELMYDNVSNEVLNGLVTMQEIVRAETKDYLDDADNHDDSIYQAKFDSVYNHYHKQGVDILKAYIKMNNITE